MNYFVFLGQQGDFNDERDVVVGARGSRARNVDGGRQQQLVGQQQESLFRLRIGSESRLIHFPFLPSTPIYTLPILLIWFDLIRCD